jgi:hypothetical protein
MSKSRNFKQGISNSKKDELRLKSILKEVKTSHINRLNKMYRQNAVITETALQSMLSSGFLPENQVKALTLYFNANGIKSINESTVRRIDRDLIRLNEGPFDWAKKMYDKGKDAIIGAGEKVVDAFQKGWSAVKSVWSNFKDLISELVEKIKGMLKKVYDLVYAKVKALATKISGKVNDEYIQNFLNKAGDVKEADGEVHANVIKEFGQLKQTVDHLKGTTDDLLTGEAFEKQMIDGSVQPDGTVPPLEPEDAKQGLETLATEAKQMYLAIFSNKQHLSELQKLKLNEGGHIEDNIKNPTLRFIVHWGLKILKAIFSPFSTLVAELAKLIVGKGLLKGTSYFCTKYKGGPGVFKFAILTTLIGELLEFIEDGLNSVFHFAPIMQMAKALAVPLGPLAAPLIDCSTTVLHIAHYSIAGMALATIIYNLMPVFKAVIQKLKGSQGGEETGGEPEVQTAGYKPKGSFKLKEGKLVFIQ